MKPIQLLLTLILGLLMFVPLACLTSSKTQLLKTQSSQVKLRSIQTRAFNTTNKNQTLRTVIATMQDLGFVVEKADETLGLVSGTKLSGYQLKMTVTVRPRGHNQLLVRANAQYNMEAIEDPAPYHDFFIALERAMFLTAHHVD